MAYGSLPEGTLVDADDVRLKLKDGETAGLTLHTIDGTIPQLRRALDRSLDAYFEFLPGVDRRRQARLRRLLAAPSARRRSFAGILERARLDHA